MPGGSGMPMADDFFETAAMLITLVLFGKYLESAVSWIFACVGTCLVSIFASS